MVHHDITSLKMHLEFFGEVPIYIGIGIQIVFALMLGGLVGYDREVKMKAAGFKTNIMICIGATLYTTISILNLNLLEVGSVIDPNRMSAQIVSGIGFLGAGAIIQGRGGVTGLTTAATIWVVAAIGYTIGVGFPIVATLFSITVLIVLRILKPINRFIEKEKDFKNFHLEVLSYGNTSEIIANIIQMEGVENYYTQVEEYSADRKMVFTNTFLRCHFRTIERINLEVQDIIKVKKVHYREILRLPKQDGNLEPSVI